MSDSNRRGYGRGGWRGRGWKRGGRGSWRGGERRGNQDWRGRGRGAPYTRGGSGYSTPVHNDNESQPSQSVSSTPASTSSLQHLAQRSEPQPRLVQTTLAPNCAYPGWGLYFPHDEYGENAEVTKMTKMFERYFLTLKLHNKLDDIEDKRQVAVDWKHLLDHEDIGQEYPELKKDLTESPQMVLSCLGLAIHQVVSEHKRSQLANESNQHFLHFPREELLSTPKIEARIHNLDTVTPLKYLKANYYGKYVCVKGTVVRVSNIKPQCTHMAFECNSCAELMSLELTDGKYAVPNRCASSECRGRTFVPKRSSTHTKTVDWQTIRLQELNSEDHKEHGRIPRTIDCHLTDNLVDSCVPGDVVSVSGVVKVNAADEGRPGKSKDKCLFLLYIHANSVINSKGHKKESGGGLAIDFSMKELYAIREIQAEAQLFKLLVARYRTKHSIRLEDGGTVSYMGMKELYAIREIRIEPQLFKLLVASLCPTICGHEMVKAGLILGLFGSHQKYANNKNRIPVRGDPHVLVVGDPGLGKSQMLQAVCNIAPRSVYVCGNTTTTAGLTVTVSKEGGGGDHCLEAGALVLADQGCCCIDEFDKMTSQHQALLEAMEQQSISIAKAGIVCNLPARTSIIAAANPIGGHYNKGKTVSENLKMGSALLSRFDLVFILLDKPDEEMDGILSDHVMSLHTNAGDRNNSMSFSASDQSQRDMVSQQEWNADRPLCQRLKVGRGENIDLIPHVLLRKYVGYARKYVHSKIGPEAAAILQTFYLELRKNHQTGDSTPITTRQLESLIRLTEARARLELREIATENDACDVVDIMKYSMSDTYSDEFGWLDFKRSQHGSGMSGRSQPKRFIAALQRVTDQTYNSIFTVPQMKQIAKEIQLTVTDFEAFISSLNNQGFLLKKGPRVYQLQTSDY